jgi:glucose-6-phosphate dehydrogenase assembly protein OpcA
VTAGGLAGQAADPVAIERELGDLWRAEAEALKQAGGGESTLARVLLLTLAVYSPSPALAQAAREVAVAINPRQPARAIIMEVLGPNGASDPILDAWVTLHCSRPSGGHQQVCGEQITLEVPPQAVRSLPGAVLPLLLTNVPSFLWWQSGSPFGQPVFKEMAPAIDRLIVDSYTFAAPERDLAALAGAVADPRVHTVTSDLSWARLGPWRYQTAQIFDAPALRPYLNRLRRATIAYCEGSPTLAWLFAGWLASRLGWKTVRRERDGDGETVHFAGGQQVTLEATPPMHASMGGYFAGVSLVADGAAFQVNRGDNNCMVARIESAEFTSERVRPLPEESNVQWLGHDLGRLNRTPIYEAALKTLADAFRLSGATQ